MLLEIIWKFVDLIHFILVNFAVWCLIHLLSLIHCYTCYFAHLLYTYIYLSFICHFYIVLFTFLCVVFSPHDLLYEYYTRSTLEIEELRRKVKRVDGDKGNRVRGIMVWANWFFFFKFCCLLRHSAILLQFQWIYQIDVPKRIYIYFENENWFWKNKFV
jgi:hypothetical protein